jgi:excisionase family DNA binding protein
MAPVSIKYSEKYLTTAQAAKELGLTTDTVKRYCNQEPQRIKGEKVGNSWMIPESEVEKFERDEYGRGRPRSG